jgi:hypothetical protein
MLRVMIESIKAYLNGPVPNWLFVMFIGILLLRAWLQSKQIAILIEQVHGLTAESMDKAPGTQI